jgi:hypothetical protein
LLPRGLLALRAVAHVGVHAWGYQVMKKWPSYRERNLLGRILTLAEQTELLHDV